MTAPPDPTNPDLLTGIRNYLSSQGIARSPRDSVSSAPPLWIDPRFGTPAPGQAEGLHPVEVGQDLVASVSKATGIVPARYEGFRRMDGVVFTVRARKSQFAYAFEQQVRAALNDKRGWTMDTVPVIESLIFRDLQPLGSDNSGWTFNMQYMFDLWAPYAIVS